MFSWQLTNALAALLIPPGSLLVLIILGLWRGRRGGRWLVATATAGLYLLSTPWVGDNLLRVWETPPVPGAQLAAGGAQAIVVLGGGIAHQAPEYGADSPHATTLVRLRYATAHAWAEGLIPHEQLVHEALRGFLTYMAGATTGSARKQIVEVLSNLDDLPVLKAVSSPS